MDSDEVDSTRSLSSIDSIASVDSSSMLSAVSVAKSEFSTDSTTVRMNMDDLMSIKFSQMSSPTTCGLKHQVLLVCHDGYILGKPSGMTSILMGREHIWKKRRLVLLMLENEVPCLVFYHGENPKACIRLKVCNSTALIEHDSDHPCEVMVRFSFPSFSSHPKKREDFLDMVFDGTDVPLLAHETSTEAHFGWTLSFPSTEIALSWHKIMSKITTFEENTSDEPTNIENEASVKIVDESPNSNPLEFVKTSPMKLDKQNNNNNKNVNEECVPKVNMKRCSMSFHTAVLTLFLGITLADILVAFWHHSQIDGKYFVHFDLNMIVSFLENVTSESRKMLMDALYPSPVLTENETRIPDLQRTHWIEALSLVKYYLVSWGTFLNPGSFVRTYIWVIIPAAAVWLVSIGSILFHALPQLFCILSSRRILWFPAMACGLTASLLGHDAWINGWAQPVRYGRYWRGYVHFMLAYCFICLGVTLVKRSIGVSGNLPVSRTPTRKVVPLVVASLAVPLIFRSLHDGIRVNSDRKFGALPNSASFAYNSTCFYGALAFIVFHIGLYFFIEERKEMTAFGIKVGQQIHRFSIFPVKALHWILRKLGKSTYVVLRATIVRFLFTPVKFIVSAFGRMATSSFKGFLERYWQLILVGLLLNGSFLFACDAVRAKNDKIRVQVEYMLGSWSLLIIGCNFLHSILTSPNNVNILNEQVIIDRSFLRHVDLHLTHVTRMIVVSGWHTMCLVSRIAFKASDFVAVKFFKNSMKIVKECNIRAQRSFLGVLKMTLLRVWNHPYFTLFAWPAALYALYLWKAAFITSPSTVEKGLFWNGTVSTYLHEHLLMNTKLPSMILKLMERVQRHVMALNAQAVALLYHYVTDMYQRLRDLSANHDVSSPTVAFTCWVLTCTIAKGRSKVNRKMLMVPVLPVYLTEVQSVVLVRLACVSFLFWIGLSNVLDGCQVTTREKKI